MLQIPEYLENKGEGKLVLKEKKVHFNAIDIGKDKLSFVY